MAYTTSALHVMYNYVSLNCEPLAISGYVSGQVML